MLIEQNSYDEFRTENFNDPLYMNESTYPLIRTCNLRVRGLRSKMDKQVKRLTKSETVGASGNANTNNRGTHVKEECVAEMLSKNKKRK